jgi:outer membrane protein assembly factor BamD (BamD/ComL family)
MSGTGRSISRYCAWPLLVASLPLATGCASMIPRSLNPWHEPDTVAESSSSYGVRQASHEQSNEDKKLEEIQWSDFQPQNIKTLAKKATGNGPNRQVAKELYLEAETLYKEAAQLPENERAERFVAAAEKYVEAAERWPGSALEQDALFMAGESYFFADRYPAANTQYERLIKAFPNSRYLDTIDQRRFAIARYWLESDRKNPEKWYSINLFDQERPWRDRRGHAMRIFDKIRIDDPTGRLADDATLAAANEYFARGQFQKADDYFTDLRTAYPTSEHQFSAHFLGMKAKLQSYLGPNYSAKSLEEAEKLIKQMRRQFPRESAAEQEYLDRESARIRYLKAEKLLRTAQYYDFRAEYRAAIIYYQKIVDEYGDTPLAEQAQARIPEIDQLPPKPEQYAPWLVNLLPKRDKIQRMLDEVERYKAAHPEAAQPTQQPQGEVTSEILPAAANLPPPPQ